MGNFDISNFYIFNLVEPVFDSNKFISRFVDENDGGANIKSPSLRLVGIQGNILFAEFLYGSQEYYDFVKAVDEYLKTQLIQNGPQWFGEKFDTDKVTTMYKSSIFLPDILPGLPYLKFRMVDNCCIVGKDNNRYDIDDLKPDMEIKLHYCIDGVEFHKNSCNAIMSVYQVNVMRNYSQTLSSIFNPDSAIIDDVESEILDMVSDDDEEF